MSEWTGAELMTAVRGYLSMQALHAQGKPFVKAEFHRAMHKAEPGKTAKIFERRMQNISAVLEAHGEKWLPGYAPSRNVGSLKAAQIWEAISVVRKTRQLGSASILDGAAPSDSDAPPKMIFFNIGWMAKYAGNDPSDPTIGGHKYLADHKHGAEAFNFAPSVSGFFQGYRPPGSHEQVRIERLGAERGAEWIDNVTVVWIAREPDTKQTLIVGWYLNARVYRYAHPGRELNGEQHSFSAEAKKTSCRLLAPVARTYQIQSSRRAPGEGFGQKPTWYGTEAVNQRVWSYIQSIEEARSFSSKKSNRPPKNPDPELRRKVERAAVKHATTYYQELYGKGSVTSVESNAKGWDLEVQITQDYKILIEVKGLLQNNLFCELTPNEYEKMMREENRKIYVIYVVTNALAELPAVPIASIFEHAGDFDWATKDGRRLVIREKTGAVLSCD